MAAKKKVAAVVAEETHTVLESRWGQPGGPSKAERMATIRELMASINKEADREIIKFAAETDTSHYLRRPTGILSLDIGMAGGFPAGAMSTIWGPESAGKDFIINCCIRMCQALHGDKSFVALLNTEFPYDKLIARRHSGVKVALSEEELECLADIRTRAGNPLTNEEADELRTQIGEIIFINAPVIDGALDTLMPVIEANVAQIVAINSLGVMQTQQKEDVDSFADHAQQSNEANLLTRFFPKLFSVLNNKPVHGSRNETAVLAVNQVRANRDARVIPGRVQATREKFKPAAGAHALKHGQAISLLLWKGSTLFSGDDKHKVLVGKEVNWELTKGKLGTHEGVKGTYNFYFETGADIARDIGLTATTYGVINKTGAWYSYGEGDNGFKVQGETGLVDVLQKNPDLTDAISHECILASKISCRYV